MKKKKDPALTIPNGKDKRPFVRQYPELKKTPRIGTWYRISNKQMKTSEGAPLRVFFRKGSVNRVLLCFSGGGVCVNEEMIQKKMFMRAVHYKDATANAFMNRGGIASDKEENPFRDWSMILIPYATGDLHVGTGEFPYTDTNGKKKILHTNGYINYTQAMERIAAVAGLDPDAVIVTGFSAGGFAAALLADDVFTNYFPHAATKVVLADAALLLYDTWQDIAVNVWHAPKAISDILTGRNLVADCFCALHNKYGDGIRLLFDTSIRDGDLAWVQTYFDTGVMEINDARAAIFEQYLKDEVPHFKAAGAYLFLWNGIPFRKDGSSMTAHTITAGPEVFAQLPTVGKSVAAWLEDAVNGTLNDYGLSLLK